MLTWLAEFLDRILSIFPRFVIIQPNEMGVLVTLGKHKKILNPGWWFWWPIFCNLDYIEVIDQIQPLDEISFTLLSKETILLQPAIRYEIVDVDKAFYQVQDLTETLYTLTKTKIREAVCEYESYDDVVNSLEEILTHVKEQMSEDCTAWGVKVHSILLVDCGIHKIYRIIGASEPIIEETE